MTTGMSVITGLVCAATLVLLTGQAEAKGKYLVAAGLAPAPSGAATLCSTYAWACDSRPGQSSASEMRVVTEINRRINRQFRQVSDESQYRQPERWALPTRRGGDCEDFALIKKRELIRSGVAPARLLLATALDRKRRSHAVLIYRSAAGDLVLDNQTDRIRGWRETGYVFLRMQDPRDPRRWVSGFSGR